MAQSVQSVDEALRIWRVEIDPAQGEARLRCLELLFRRIEIGNSESGRCCIMAELARAGAVAALSSDVRQPTTHGLRSVDAADLLLRMLQQNEEACLHFGSQPEFQMLVAWVMCKLQQVANKMDPGLSALVPFHCVNLVLAVSSDARDVVCSGAAATTSGPICDALQVLSRLLDCKDTPAFSEMALMSFCYLSTPDLKPGNPRYRGLVARGRGDSSICAICMEGVGSTEIQSWWRCSTCWQGLHGKCATAWLSQSRRCPYCRAFNRDTDLGKIFLHPQQLVTLLNSERALVDIPFTFSIATLLMNLVSAEDSHLVFETLEQRGFFGYLEEAANAALHGNEWPAGSKCYPLVWKVAITVAQVVRCGHRTEVQNALHPIVKFLLHSESDEAQRTWCSRALVAFAAEAEGHVHISSLLDEEVGESYDQACQLFALKETIDAELQSARESSTTTP